jgi:hypothetical protein
LKKWLQNRFLPMWAKQTLLWEKQQLERENLALRQELDRLEAYVEGVKTGIRAGKRVNIINRGGDG